MRVRRFIAGFFDRIIVLVLFVILVHIKYGMFMTSTVAGMYNGGCVLSRPSTYEHISTLQQSVWRQDDTNGDVDPYFKAQLKLWCLHHDELTIKDIDYDITKWFVIANMIYFTICFMIFKKSFFEGLCGIDIVWNNSTPVSRLYLLYRALVYFVLIMIFILLRFLLDSTYLNISIIFLLANWMLIFLIDKSLFDILSFTKMVKIKR